MKKSRTGKPPSFVSSKRAAAQLDLSASTFMAWVRDGILPGPEPGSPPSSPRWRWSRIERWMAGDRSDVPGNQAELFPPELAHGHRRRGPKPGSGGRPRKSTAQLAAELGEELAEWTGEELSELAERIDG